MKIVILTNNDAYGGILCYPLLKKYHKSISAIFLQDGIMNSQMSSFDLYKHITKKSGFTFSSSLAVEFILFKIAIVLRHFFHLNDDKDDCYLELPSNLGKKFEIPIYNLHGTVNDEINLQKITNLSPDLIITLRFGEILKQPLLSIPALGIINFHPALLPSYQGLSSVFQAKFHDEETIGYSIHFMDENIDTGKIVTQGIVKQKYGDSVTGMCLRTYYIGSYGILDAIQKIENNNSLITPDANVKSSYYSWPNKNDVKKFLCTGNKLIKIQDFFSALFYKPCNM